jgi:hypothetical protein
MVTVERTLMGVEQILKPMQAQVLVGPVVEQTRAQVCLQIRLAWVLELQVLVHPALALLVQEPVHPVAVLPAPAVELAEVVHLVPAQALLVQALEQDLELLDLEQELLDQGQALVRPVVVLERVVPAVALQGLVADQVLGLVLDREVEELNNQYRYIAGFTCKDATPGIPAIILYQTARGFASLKAS